MFRLHSQAYPEDFPSVHNSFDTLSANPLYCLGEKLLTPVSLFTLSYD